MSTAKILEAFRGGMTAEAAVLEFGIRPVDRSDFLETLHNQYEQRLLVCGTRLDAKDVNELRSLVRSDVLFAKLPESEG